VSIPLPELFSVLRSRNCLLAANEAAANVPVAERVVSIEVVQDLSDSVVR